MNATNKPAAKPTALNVSVLKRHFNGALRATNRVHAGSANHFNRCLKAGLAVVEGSELVLTEAGVEAIANSR